MASSEGREKEGIGEPSSEEGLVESPDESKWAGLSAAELKSRGNALYMASNFKEAVGFYSHALKQCGEAEDTKRERAVFLSNRAACHSQLEDFEAAVRDCTAAIELDVTYPRPLLRRARALRKLDRMMECVEDYKKYHELQPATAATAREASSAEQELKVQTEKQKEEMLGKLKDLGNGLLGKFGLSLNNFKTEQDPKTGSYNISFQQ